MEFREDVPECQRVSGGNTGPPDPTPKKKTSNPVVNWCFTLHVSEVLEPTPKQLWHTCKAHCKKFTFQLEKTKEGKLHYQGHFTLKERDRLNGVKNLFCNTIHLEQTMNIWAADKYCQKEESRVQGPWTESREPLNLITTLRPAQETIVRELTTQNDREILWIYDPEGGLGKTQLAKWLAFNWNALVLQNAKTADIAYAVSNMSPLNFFVVDLPRTSAERFNYGALEAVKNGLIFSSKYESRSLVFDGPKVVILSNNLPKVHALSLDRWKILQRFGDNLINVTTHVIEAQKPEEMVYFEEDD